MAIMKNVLIAASVLASSALAVPLAAVHKRDLIMETQTVTDWVTVDQQATVWVDGNGKPVSTEMPSMSGAFSVQPSPSSPFSSLDVAPSSAYSAPAAPSMTSAPAAAPAPAAPSTSAAPASSDSPAVFASQAIPSTSAAWSSSAPASSAAPASAASSSQAPSSSGGSGVVCQGEGSNCVGDITHWDGGLGACGWNVDTNSDMEIAMPYGLMGTQSNGNPYCGKSLTIKGPSGNLVQATVGDKCMGCDGDSIDLTNVLFTAVAPNGNGRVHDIQWWFN